MRIAAPLLCLALFVLWPAPASAQADWPARAHASFDAALEAVEAERRAAGTVTQASDATRRWLELLQLHGRHQALAAAVGTLAGDESLAFDLGLHQVRLALADDRERQAAELLLPRQKPDPADANQRDALRLIQAQVDARLGRRDEAIEALQQLRTEAQSAGRPGTVVHANLQLAERYLDAFDYAQALLHHEQALRAAPAWALQWQLQARMGMAQMHNMLGRRDEALRQLEEVETDFRRSGNRKGEADALLLRGFALGRAGRADEAAVPLRAALQLREAHAGAADVLNALIHLCGRLVERSQLVEADTVCARTLALAERSQRPATLWDVHATLAELHAALGTHRLAYEHMKRAERELLRHSKQQLASHDGLIRERLEAERQRLENQHLAERLTHEQEDHGRMRLLAIGLALSLGLLALAGVLLVRLYLRTRRLAERDGLTGLMNRRRILEVGETERERASRHGLPLSLLVLDLDHFKAINDGHGHAAGDRVLKQVAQYLLATLRRGDAAGRIGGEEFLVLLPHADALAALQLAERLREGIAQNVLAAPDQPVTLSIGVAAWQSDQTLAQCMQAADQALYRAKAEGRNRCELAS